MGLHLVSPIGAANLGRSPLLETPADDDIRPNFADTKSNDCGETCLSSPSNLESMAFGGRTRLADPSTRVSKRLPVADSLPRACEQVNMREMCRLVVHLLVFLMFLAPPPLAAGQAHSVLGLGQYQHSRRSVDDGFPAPVYSIVQSTDGYLWLGTRDGLLRYDGIRFEAIPPDPKSASKLGPLKLLAARDGSVFVGYRRGGIAVYRDGALHDISPPGWISKSLAWMVQSADGAVWVVNFVSSQPVARYRDRRWTYFTRREGLNGEIPLGVLAARDGALWITTPKSILVLRAGASRFVQFGAVRGDAAAIAEDQKGRIWLSDAAGSRVIEPVQATGGTRRYNYPAPPFLRAREQIVDRSGNLWSSDGVSGVTMTRSPDPLGAASKSEAAAQVERFGTEKGLVSDNVTKILEDREGSIWVASLLGLDKFSKPGVVSEPALTKLAPWGYTLLGSSDGNVYVGQGDSIYRIRPGERPEAIFQNVTNDEAICEGRGGSLWLALKPNMVQVKGQSQSRLALPREETGSIESCAISKNGTLWIHTDILGVLYYSGGRWRKTSIPVDNFGSRMIVADRQGHIIAYAHGALYSCGDNGSCLKVRADPRLSLLNVQVLYQGPRDLFAAGGDGMFRITGAGIQHLSNDRVPALGGIVGMVQTPSGQTWLAGNRGIMRIPTAELERAFDNANVKLAPFILDTKDGARGTSIPSGVRDAAQGGDGRLWFATSAGVVWVDPARLPRNTFEPKVAIGTLIAGGITYRDPVRITLPAGTTSGEIDFAVLSYVIPQRIQVRYQLQGSDADWVDPGPRRQMFFSNLKPGTYRFRVVAANNDGVWNRTGATLEIIIPPTFAQSIWLKLIGLLVLAAALWLAYSVRVRHLTGRLRATLEVRLAERERIARELHDTLLQGFQGLILRFQAVADRVPATNPWRDALYRELDYADAVLIEGRDRVGEVRATSSTEDLAQSFMDLAAELKKSGTKTQFEITVEGHPRALHPIVRQEVERIGQEAIRNALQHSRASKVTVFVAYHRRQLRLAICDDGDGLPEDVLTAGNRAGHFGLTGMHERAKRIGGMLTISSRQGRGTQVLLSVRGKAAYAAPRWRWRLPFAKVDEQEK